jgi:hypothetical protein
MATHIDRERKYRIKPADLVSPVLNIPTSYFIDLAATGISFPSLVPAQPSYSPQQIDPWSTAVDRTAHWIDRREALQAMHPRDAAFWSRGDRSLPDFVRREFRGGRRRTHR